MDCSVFMQKNRNTMNNNDQFFFKAISYTAYQKMSKQTQSAFYLFLIISLMLCCVSINIFYQWNTIKQEVAPYLEQQTKLAKIILQKQELIQKLEPLYKQNKKKIRILEKLYTMYLIMQLLFDKQESIHINSCLLTNKKITVIFESNHTSYREWIKKLLESKLIKNIITTQVKKNESNSQITINGEIIF